MVHWVLCRLRGAAVCRAWQRALAQGSLLSLSLCSDYEPRKLEWAARAGPSATVVHIVIEEATGHMGELTLALASVKVCQLGSAFAPRGMHAS